MKSSPKPWFGRKKFGWGWGPASWQGWLVVTAYVAFIQVTSHLFPPKIHHTDFMIGLATATVILLAVLVWKSERRK
jgi:hypothetical protein